MTTALILTTYNRPELLRRCLSSLSNLSELPDLLIVIDDASTDKETVSLVNELSMDCQVIKVMKKKNEGIKSSLAFGFDLAFRACDIVMNLDADAVVKPEFISRIKELKSRFPDKIVSGFNCNNHKNPVLVDGADYVERRHANGINMCMNYKQFFHIVRPSLGSSGNWDFNSTHQNNFIISKPSVVQHIGQHDSTMGHVDGDVACDFKLLSLPSVTLFGIDSFDPKGIIRAAETSCMNIDFGAVKIITEDLFTKNGTNEQRRTDYSSFMVRDLHKYVGTEYVLTIHADGYVLNADAWTDDFLQYDYIGAKWWFNDGMNVGNGGFSLRSIRLLLVLREIFREEAYRNINVHPEDEFICRKLRPTLEKNYGIKFAPDEIADKFSLECWSGNRKYNGSFGFHGKNLDFSSLPKHLRPYEPSFNKASALEMWKNRPKQQPVQRYVPRTKRI